MRCRHIAFYKFIPLENLAALKKELLAKLDKLGIYGTILIAHEGLNGGLSGSTESIQALQKDFQNDPRFSDLSYKENQTDQITYKRRLVKIRKEIVTMGVPERSPPEKEAARIQPKELQEWLQSGKEVILLDTRNNYEFELGSFDNALAIDIQHFKDFPAKAKQLPKEWKDRPIVSFCTGGIRCEKAAPYLDSLGFSKIYQLDGGILRYFEEIGGDHWHGDCFVFDERVAVGPNLLASGAAICSHCNKVLAKEFHGQCPDCKSA